MSILSTGSPDPEDPGPTPEEPESPAVARSAAARGAPEAQGETPERLAGSPPPQVAAPHEGLIGEPEEPVGDDPRPGNVGHSAEAIRVDEHDDVLDEASDESFPASDPPSFSGATSGGDDDGGASGLPGHHGLGRVVDESPPASAEKGGSLE
jgi:hypothetical protein